MKSEETLDQSENSLVPLEKYLEAGVHIGSKFKSGDMRRFIYKRRQDGLCILNIGELNKRVKTASKFIAQYEPEDVLIVAGRSYAQKPAKKLAEMLGARQITKRFVPGTLTNPSNKNFMEPKLILASDPPIDRQAIKEAVKAKIPVISLCDTSNWIRNIDLIIPTNNKGKKSLALIYWLLARETLKARGTIKTDEEFTAKIEDFESTIIIKREERPTMTDKSKDRRFTRGRKK